MDFDYIIVGGGVAGCILARRLSADPALEVALVEAGGHDTSPLIRAPGGMLPMMMTGRNQWPFLSAPQRWLDDRVLFLPRGKVLGGGSSINGMVYDRGFASDYDLWAEQGCEGWSFAEVLPYFRRVERWHGGAGTWHGGDGPIAITRARQDHPFARAFLAAGQQAGFARCEDLNGEQREGFGAVDLTIDRGRRASASSAYLRPVLGRPNLRVITGAQVCRVLIAQGRANGITWRRNGQDETAQARREVILAAGAIATPQLLMLSGIGPAAHLARHGITVLHDLPGVGQGLQDHLAAHVKFTSTKPLSMLRYLNPLRAGMAMLHYLALRGGPLADPGMSVAAFVKSDPALAEADLKLLLVMALFSNNGRTLTPRHGFYAHINVIRPEARGSVTLASADPFAAPVIDQNYNATPRDRQVLREGVRIARHVFRQAAFDDFRGEEIAPGQTVQSDEEIDAYIRATAEADYHSTSTARMGQDRLAVVTPCLHLRGVDGVRVVDASVMPHLPGGNTAIPVAMIAEKAADMILGKPAPPPEHPI